MSGLFPLRTSVDLDEERKPRLVDLDDDVADEVFDALSSRTTREIFAELHSSPQTASDLADVTDTSVQNAQYHLEKLVAADLVEVVDTWYSERGTEMKVYAPTDESLVLFAGDDKRGSLRALLKRLVGVLALLFPVSAVAAWLADRFSRAPTAEPDVEFKSGEVEGTGGYEPFSAASGSSGGGDGGDAAGSAVETPAPEPTATGGEDTAMNVESGSVDVAADDGTPMPADAPGGGDGGSGAGGGDAGSMSIEATTPTPDAKAFTGEATTTESVNVSTRSQSNLSESMQSNLSDSAQSLADATPTDIPPQELVDVTVDTTAGTDPAVVAGLSFFLGGLFVLALVGIAWYWRS